MEINALKAAHHLGETFIGHDGKEHIITKVQVSSSVQQVDFLIQITTEEGIGLFYEGLDPITIIE